MTTHSHMVATATAQDVIDRAPLGALIRFSDGTPQPPARFKRKLKDWENRNGTSRLVENSPPRNGSPAMFTLHLGDFGREGTVVMVINKVFSGRSAGRFVVEQVPQPGEALVLTDGFGRTELRHLAPNAAAAAAWLEAHRYSNARIEVVPAASPIAA